MSPEFSTREHPKHAHERTSPSPARPGPSSMSSRSPSITSVAGGGAVGEGIAVDPKSGTVYVAGNFKGKVDFDPGPGTLD